MYTQSVVVGITHSMTSQLPDNTPVATVSSMRHPESSLPAHYNHARRLTFSKTFSPAKKRDNALTRAHNVTYIKTRETQLLSHIPI